MESEAYYMANLRDCKSNMEKYFDTIRKHFKKYDNLDPSEKELVMKQVASELEKCDINLADMNNFKMESKYENVQKAFSDQISVYKVEVKKLKEEYYNKQNQANNLNNLINPDDVNIRMKNNKQLTVEEGINKGRDIMKSSEAALNRMNNKVDDTIKVGQAALSDLAAQKEKIKQVNSDLKEIDYSLNRAGKQLATMFKMYATDKLILCMIVLIVLIIIAIIIVAAVGGDKANNFNVPHDIFSNSGTNTTVTKTRLLFIN
jgi:hypothetical protein